ncbi:MAG: sigma-54 dependent transcriptional regulator [Planctomycetota bacterium]|nr:sigma-54 dependent transcriptional regulator [Planctomycetota bacterium]
MSVTDLRFLTRLLGQDEPWAYTVVTSIILCDGLLARGLVTDAARALGKATHAYRKLMQLARRHRPGYTPPELEQYVRRCRSALDAFEPPIAHGPNPVRKITEVCRKLEKPRRVHAPGAAIDALDAVITAGQAADQQDLEVRVVEQIARMLGSRVLFHHVRGHYLVRESQQVHTLSSWTMLSLARTATLRSHRIKRKPEFWRPEQRRPRGIVVFPIGDGVAAIARSSVFDRRDVAAVDTILRFLADRPGTAPTHETQSKVTLTTPDRPNGNRHGLIGSAPAWNRVLDDVWKVGPTTCSVVLRGETGTGKDLVARALHLNSNRARGPFVAVNCAAIHPETMLAELFGHIRGAFSGADRSRDGLIREAHRGTLFLDEVGDMPHAMQVALLRTLQDKRVRPVGSSRTQRVDTRVVAATNLDLEAQVRAGSFREDLYHRLQVMEIQLPPLRARLEDIPALAAHLLDRCGHGDRSLTSEAAAALAAYDWPGNVRELENVLQAAALLGSQPRLDRTVIEAVLQTRRRSRKARPAATRMRPRPARILQLVDHEWCSAPHLARVLGVSTRTVNRDLHDLIDRGLIEGDGAARAPLPPTARHTSRFVVIDARPPHSP